MRGEDWLAELLLRRVERAWDRFEVSGSDADLLRAEQADAMYLRVRGLTSGSSS